MSARKPARVITARDSQTIRELQEAERDGAPYLVGGVAYKVSIFGEYTRNGVTREVRADLCELPQAPQAQAAHQA